VGNRHRRRRLYRSARLKIALVIGGGLNTLTGGYLYDRQMVDHLRRRGHRVEVITLSGERYGRRLAKGLRPSTAGDLARISCDVMVQDALVHPALWLANRRMARRRRFPRIALAHMVLSAQPRPAWQNRCHAAIEGAYHRSVDGCIANSRTTLAHLARWGVRHRPFVVAPPGGDRLGSIAPPSRIRERAMAPGPLRLLFLGNVLPGKGLLPLLAALERVSDVDWRLTAAGSLTMAPAHVRAVRNAVKHSGVRDRVRLAGPLAGRELTDLLARAHVMAMPFSHEGFGMALVEGMAYGLPAIASSRGAARETVAHGVNGVLVPPGRFDLAGAAVRRLDADREALARMSARAFEAFCRHPTWLETLGAVEAFLRRVARP
jgi:glycosyltransferase involved in cell wall biosynthesis